jgi:hypothetical protein
MCGGTRRTVIENSLRLTTAPASANYFWRGRKRQRHELWRVKIGWYWAHPKKSRPGNLPIH